MVSAATSARRERGPHDSGSLTEAEPRPQNHVHAQLLLLIVANLRATISRRRSDVTVVSDVFWIDGRDPKRVAPDVGVAFGVVDVPRSSYVTEDAGVGLAFVVEVISPSDHNPLDPTHVDSLPARYDRRGVEEYIEFRMADGSLRIFDRRSGAWGPVADPWAWTSALTGFHARALVPAGPLGFTLAIDGLDGPWVQPETMAAELDAARAEVRADAARIDALAARLREAGIDPDSVV